VRRYDAQSSSLTSCSVRISALGCSDVVKKPKLDIHRGRCHASFTCIDCSTTFDGPAQYKGHTSCITEAEKYQKSLYKGPKTVRDASLFFLLYLNPQVSLQGQTNANPRGRQHNGYMNGNGRYTYGQQQTSQNAPRSSFGRPYSATGANETPLGTPVRMSPVDAVSPPPVAASSSSNEAPSKPANGASVKPTTLKGNEAKAGRVEKRKVEEATEVRSD
jgi:cell growth-regulating nucleolar protein